MSSLHAMRHSAAHVLATAIKRKWPETKFGVGPVIENGFYYDVDLGGDARISEENFKGLEKEMRKIIAEDQPFEHSTMPIDAALIWAKENNQPYKEELLQDLKREGTTLISEFKDSLSGFENAANNAGNGGASLQDMKIKDVGFYTNGEFTDLCRGPHVESTGKIGAFKLTKVAGAYWRGNEENPQMQRVYGVAFETKEQLDEYLKMQEEAKARDHRKLGKELDLFAVSPLIGSGFPLFTPRGTILRKNLEGLSEQARAKYGWQKVHIPHLTSLATYEQSGHAEKFGDEMMTIDSKVSSNVYAVKPMNCPHHIQLYASRPRSYRDMPQLYMETTQVYRDEQSGELHGLERVRSITQDDGHAFCTDDQIAEVVGNLLKATQHVNEVLDTPLKYVSLSFRDDDGIYSGSEEVWEKAQNMIEQLAIDNGIEYKICPGEAAHYGPKIDFVAVDAMGRETQVSTVQLDFVQPEKFNLEYVDSDGEKKRPVMVHAALLGSTERRMSVYIEHTAGRFPFWIAPEQVRILTINDQVLDYVKQITDVMDDAVLMKPLKYNELRYSVDDRNESLGKKISEAQRDKIPVIMVVGPKDIEANQISIRTQDGEEKVAMNDFAQWLVSHK